MYKFHPRPCIISAKYLETNTVEITSNDSPPIVTVVNIGDWLVVIKDCEGVDTFYGYTHEDFMNAFEPDNAEAQTYLDEILGLLNQ